MDANHAVKASLTVLNNMRTNAEDDFKKIFDHACQISDSLSPPVQISLPRMARVQKHRENYHSSTPETYFRVSLFIPLLDNIIDDLSNRLPPETLNIFNLNVILPRVMGTNDEKNEEEQLRQILTDYGAILDTHSITLMGEYRVWKEHWKNKQDDIPHSLNDIINSFNADMFPAINLLLKILISMPASVATAERSFSSLRRIKTRLRNNMTEERLSGLACINLVILKKYFL